MHRCTARPYSDRCGSRGVLFAAVIFGGSVLNKKDFRRYMQQGLGRCVTELQKAPDISKYKEIVLWGCLHDLSYDPQCEGTRAYYVYELTTYFKDEPYFVIPVIDAFAHLPCRSTWEFSHFSNLLCCFARNGNADAQNALKEKYDALFSALLGKRRSAGHDSECICFERLCLAISSIEDTDGILRMASDMGRLFRENPHYSGKDFLWFCSCMDHGTEGKKLLSALRRKARRSQDLLCFYEHYLKAREEMKESTQIPLNASDAGESREKNAPDERPSPSSRARIGRDAVAKNKTELAGEILAASDPDTKATLLSAFSLRHTNFPLSHEAIIAYSGSSHPELRENAFEVLTHCQSEEVRAYALALLAGRTAVPYAVRMLLSNYRAEDKQRLLEELYKIRADRKDSSGWHRIGLHILGMKEHHVRLPKEFFLYIYETTLCSCCREYAVSELSKRHWLTKEMIEECRYDSNDSIADYMNRYYPAR